jgi:hypothetical protein
MCPRGHFTIVEGKGRLEMKALSLQQPYASLILERDYEDNPRKPLKPIENRAWPLPSTFILPQKIWVHASLGLYNVSLSTLKEIMTASQWLRCRAHLHAIYSEYESYRRDKKFLQRLGKFGCLLGTIVVTGQITKSDDPWFFGPYGYTLEYPEKLSKPIPYRGQLGFFEVTL